MKVTVCELPDAREGFERAFDELIAHVRAEASELVLLPEMPAYPWFAGRPAFDEQVWREALAAHDALVARLPELAPAAVLGSRPARAGRLRLNQGFAWTASDGYRRAHEKHYFPHEPGFFEDRWFDRRERDFTPICPDGVLTGFLICTDLMFNEWARHYGRAGAQVIAVPRATVRLEPWRIAARMAALVSGAFVLTSNRAGPGGPGGEIRFGGGGWVVGPDGEIVAGTSAEQPFVTVDIDLVEAFRAKRTYPRYVRE